MRRYSWRFSAGFHSAGRDSVKVNECTVSAFGDQQPDRIRSEGRAGNGFKQPEWLGLRQL